MATYSSVLAWRISGTGEPGGLPSLGWNRVRHHWNDLAAAAAPALEGRFFTAVPPGKPNWARCKHRNGLMFIATRALILKLISMYSEDSLTICFLFLIHLQMFLFSFPSPPPHLLQGLQVHVYQVKGNCSIALFSLSLWLSFYSVWVWFQVYSIVISSSSLIFSSEEWIYHFFQPYWNIINIYLS